MRYLILHGMVIIGIWLLLTIIGSIVDLFHKPYIRWKDSATGIVHIYMLARGKGSYSQFVFHKIDGKWRYKLTKDEQIGFWMILILILVAILVAMLQVGTFSLAYLINGGIVAVEIAAYAVFFTPLKAYLKLRKQC